MLQTQERICEHPSFGELKEKDLQKLLDSLAIIQHELDKFDLWEVENMLNGGTHELWEEKAIACFSKIRKEKMNLDSKVYQHLLN